MELNTTDFIHRNHLDIFISAAKELNCHILVRETGRMALSWVGKWGYTGKRADMKAKTANNPAHYQIAGLVCSPYLQPYAFTGDRLISARKEWAKCQHLITFPQNGFSDNQKIPHCQTPYILQTNPNHRHYGCVAFVEMGLVSPKYIHGDYDLYAIIPAGQPFDPNAIKVYDSILSSPMETSVLTPQQLSVLNKRGEFSFQVANHIDTRIARRSSDLLGGLMINHGEQINLGQKGQTFEKVLAVMPTPNNTQGVFNGQYTQILHNESEHRQFYQHA